jgi:hypothetical protein
MNLFFKLKVYVLSRVCGDYYKTGIGLTTGFIGSDLLDHTQLHTITVYALYDSQQLSLFSCSENFGSNSVTTAATNSYGVPCHYSLTGAAPLSSTPLLNYLFRWPPTSGYIAQDQTTKKTPLRFPYCWNDVITGTDRKENAGRFHCCVAWQRL